MKKYIQSSFIFFIVIILIMIFGCSDINMKADNVTEDNSIFKIEDQKSKKIKDKLSNLIPQEVEMHVNFNNKDVFLTQYSVNTVPENVERWSRSDNRDLFLSQEDNKIYQIVEISKNIQLPDKKVLIADDCKKLFQYAYLSTNNRVYDVSNAVGDITFECIAEDVTDVWQDRTTGNILYFKNNILYSYDGYHKKALTTQINFSIQEVYCIDDNAKGIFFTDYQNNLWGIGRNLAYLLNPDASHTSVYDEPIKISSNIKDVLACDNYTVYFLTMKDELLYAGLPEYNKEILDEQYKKKKYFDLKTSVIYPEKIADNVKEIKYVERFKSILVLDKSGDLYKYSVERKKINNLYKKKVVVKHIKSHIEKLFNDDFFLSNEALYFTDSDYIFIDRIKSNEDVFYDYWWIEYKVPRIKNKFYSVEPYLVDNNTSSVKGQYYKKKNTLFKFTTQGIKKKISKNVKDYFSFNGDCSYLKRDRLYYKGSGMMHFAYLDGTKYENKRLKEKGIKKIWYDENNIAFIKNKKLYSYGQIERLRWADRALADYESDTYFRNYNWDIFPPNLVEYSGLNVKKITGVYFDNKYIYINMKNGVLYKILPKQKAKKEKIWFRKKCAVSPEMKMKISNIKEIFQSADEVLFNETDDDLFNVRLFNDNSAQVWYGNKDRKEKISDVKNIYAKDGIYLLLTIDGNLYGWGYNEFKSITSENVKWLSFDKKVLIDTNVKQMSISSNDALSSAAGVFYLKNNGDLYFRGYLG